MLKRFPSKYKADKPDKTAVPISDLNVGMDLQACKYRSVKLLKHLLEGHHPLGGSTGPR